MYLSKLRIFTSAVICLCLWGPAELPAQVFFTKTGHVEFESEVPLHSFTGRSDRLVGKINVSDKTVDFYVDMHTLKTGIEKRDKDMLETIEAEKYPFAEFFGKLTSDFNPDSPNPQKATVKGDFKIHGVSKPMTITGELQMTEEGLKVTADWVINMKEFNIKPPGILFYRVEEEIDVTIETTLSPEKS